MLICLLGLHQYYKLTEGELMTVGFIVFNNRRWLSFVPVFFSFFQVQRSFAAHFMLNLFLCISPSLLLLQTGFFFPTSRSSVYCLCIGYCFLYVNFISCYCTEFFNSLSKFIIDSLGFSRFTIVSSV